MNKKSNLTIVGRKDNVVTLSSPVIKAPTLERSVEYQSTLKHVYSIWRLIEDQLFVHRNRGLRPTEKDEDLNVEINQVLIKMEEILDYLASMNEVRKNT